VSWLTLPAVLQVVPPKLAGAADITALEMRTAVGL
jgi:hypothetical protein